MEMIPILLIVFVLLGISVIIAGVVAIVLRRRRDNLKIAFIAHQSLFKMHRSYKPEINF